MLFYCISLTILIPLAIGDQLSKQPSKTKIDTSSRYHEIIIIKMHFYVSTFIFDLKQFCKIQCVYTIFSILIFNKYHIDDFASRSHNSFLSKTDRHDNSL